MLLPQGTLQPLEVTDPMSQTWLEWGLTLYPHVRDLARPDIPGVFVP